MIFTQAKKKGGEVVHFSHVEGFGESYGNTFDTYCFLLGWAASDPFSLFANALKHPYVSPSLCGY